MDIVSQDKPLALSDRFPRNTILRALCLVIFLNLLWGLAYGLLDVLNRHFQVVLHVSQGKSGLLQTAFFGGYLTMTIPASMITTRFGYKGGILCGLFLYAAGALAFVPATYLYSFSVFLFALYLVSSGIACLEVSAHPYVLTLGRPESAPGRLSFAQGFWGVGSILGPLIGAVLFFSDAHAGGATHDTLMTVRITYVVIAIVVSLVACLIALTPMPEVADGQEAASTADTTLPLFRRPRFVFGIVTMFFGLAAQVSVASFFINYAIQQSVSFDSRKAAFVLSVGMVLFTIGRFTGPLAMKRVYPGRVMSVACACIIALLLVGTLGLGAVSVYAVIASFFFMSIVFPTIVAISLEDLGSRAKRGAAFVLMAVCGCAIIPVLVGHVADIAGDAVALLIPHGLLPSPSLVWRMGIAIECSAGCSIVAVDARVEARDLKLTNTLSSLRRRALRAMLDNLVSLACFERARPGLPLLALAGFLIELPETYANGDAS